MLRNEGMEVLKVFSSVINSYVYERVENVVCMVKKKHSWPTSLKSENSYFGLCLLVIEQCDNIHNVQVWMCVLRTKAEIMWYRPGKQLRFMWNQSSDHCSLPGLSVTQLCSVVPVDPWRCCAGRSMLLFFCKAVIVCYAAPASLNSACLLGSCGIPLPMRSQNMCLGES